MPDLTNAANVIALRAAMPQHVSHSDRPAPCPDSTPASLAARSPEKHFVPFETLWDVNDVAEFLKCSRSWVYKAAENGTLPCLRYGNLLRFDRVAVHLYGQRKGTA
jgi:excisionase family DNA binding protein